MRCGAAFRARCVIFGVKANQRMNMPRAISGELWPGMSCTLGRLSAKQHPSYTQAPTRIGVSSFVTPSEGKEHNANAMNA